MDEEGVYKIVKHKRRRKPKAESTSRETPGAVIEFPANHEFQFHPLCCDPLIVGDEFEAFCSDIRDRGQLEPITLHPDGTVLDGRNRVLACGILRIGVKAITYRGDDPKAFVESVNFHRRHLTLDQKRERAAAILRDNPHMSDSAVARISGVSDKTVASVRSRSEIPSVSTRTDTRGRRQPATRKPKGKSRRQSLRQHRCTFRKDHHGRPRKFRSRRHRHPELVSSSNSSKRCRPQIWRNSNTGSGIIPARPRCTEGTAMASQRQREVGNAFAFGGKPGRPPMRDDPIRAALEAQIRAIGQVRVSRRRESSSAPGFWDDLQRQWAQC